MRRPTALKSERPPGVGAKATTALNVIATKTPTRPATASWADNFLVLGYAFTNVAMRSFM